MPQLYQHLGVYSDWVEEAYRQRELYPPAAPGRETQARVREVLGFCTGPETPLGVRVEETWKRDGIVGESVSWSVGYGPRTGAYVLRPEDIPTRCHLEVILVLSVRVLFDCVTLPQIGRNLGSGLSHPALVRDARRNHHRWFVLVQVADCGADGHHVWRGVERWAGADLGTARSGRETTSRGRWNRDIGVII